MSKEFSAFANIEIEKQKFHSLSNPRTKNDIDVDKTLLT